MFRSVHGSRRGGKLSQPPRDAGWGLHPEGNREPLQVWEQNTGVMGAAWSFGWTAWKLKDLAGTGLKRTVYCLRDPSPGYHWPKSWEGMRGEDTKGELAS